MGNTKSKIKKTKSSKTVTDQSLNSNINMSKQSAEVLPSIWNPTFNEFKLGDSPEAIMTHLPRPFVSVEWDILPIADEYKHDEVRYFWLPFGDFGNNIIKFIPPSAFTNGFNYVCFLFVNKKLFHLSVRLFHDAGHANYNKIIEAYSQAINTSLITSNYGKEFHYEDNQIMYFTCYSSDHNYLYIDLIQKNQTKSTDGYFTDRISFHHNETRIISCKPLISTKSTKYDIMISYSYEDKDLSHQLYYNLLDNQYRVWINLENMSVQRMNEAIENTDFVLICMSDAYKSSASCQLEAKYVFKTQCCFIPIVVQKDFVANGWLEMLCGLRFRIDFTETTFEEAFDRLLKEIQRYRILSAEDNQL